MNVTAKEDLRDMVGDLSEDDARAWFERIRLEHGRTAPPNRVRHPDQPGVVHRMDRETARALLDQWCAEEPVMTEAEWAEFAKALDEERQERPLFR